MYLMYQNGEKRAAHNLMEYRKIAPIGVNLVLTDAMGGKVQLDCGSHKEAVEQYDALMGARKSNKTVYLIE